MLEGRVTLETANRACRALESLRPGSESHVSAQLQPGIRIYFRYHGEQIPPEQIESAAERAL